MFRFSLDMLISNLVDFSLCMTLNFGDKLRAQKKILSTVAGRWRAQSIVDFTFSHAAHRKLFDFLTDTECDSGRIFYSARVAKT